MGMPNFESHTLFQGDCLAIMQGMNSETVDLIACDPPFNTARDWTGNIKGSNRTAKFTDRWRWEPIHDEWMDSIESLNPALCGYILSVKDKEPNMAAFLCWLGVRCWEMHRILRNTGSLYLHLDHTAAAYAKVMLDCIFGRQNFRNELIWHYPGENLSRKKFARSHDTLLLYAKSKLSVFNPQARVDDPKEILKLYPFEDATGRYKLTSCQNNADRPNMVYPWKGNTRQWRFSKETMQQYEAAGLLVYDEENIPRRKTYSHKSLAGGAMFDTWTTISGQPGKAESTGYPTQKPVALYERMIKASSNPGDMVFDPFAGCATTLVAAERLGRQWVGCDLWDGTKDILVQRLHDNRPLEAEPPKINHTTEFPIRNDNNGTAAPFLPELEYQQKKTRFTKDQMKAILIKQWTAICWGCGFEPPKTNNRAQDADSRHFDLDHIDPKSEGGSNELDNRAILCRPCNGRKGNRMTLTALRQANKRDGFWYGNPPIDQRIDIPTARQWAREYLADAAQQGGGGGDG